MYGADLNVKNCVSAPLIGFHIHKRLSHKLEIGPTMVVSQGSSDGWNAPIHSIMTLLNLARTQVTWSGMEEAIVSAMTVSSNYF